VGQVATYLISSEIHRARLFWRVRRYLANARGCSFEIVKRGAALKDATARDSRHRDQTLRYPADNS